MFLSIKFTIDTIKKHIEASKKHIHLILSFSMIFPPQSNFDLPSLYFTIVLSKVLALHEPLEKSVHLRATHTIWQQKSPGNLTIPGYLTFEHNVPCGTQYILISDYSMIEATRPDPTVRPPPRL